jgi:hypothetical protein
MMDSFWEVNNILEAVGMPCKNTKKNKGNKKAFLIWKGFY